MLKKIKLSKLITIDYNIKHVISFEMIWKNYIKMSQSFIEKGMKNI